MNQLSDAQLNSLNKDALVILVSSMQSQIQSLKDQLDYANAQLADTSKQIELLTEQIRIMNQRQFGRKSEKASDEFDGQMTIFDFFNEAEFRSELPSVEPQIEEIVIHSYRRKKTVGKREETLEGLPTRIFHHTLSKEELSEMFPEGYKELPEQVYKRLSIIPETFIADEHHVHVYASKKNTGKIVRANRPKDLFRDSIATPSLLAAVMNAKYANAVPLERQNKAFKQNGVDIPTNTLARWIISGAENYLSLMTDRLHQSLYSHDVIHADETPAKVMSIDGQKIKNGKQTYMWVYRNNPKSSSEPVIIYDWQPSRKADHPDEFLKEYHGVLVTDGYGGYHKIDRLRSDLTVAGCWVHARRPFAEFLKSVEGKDIKGTIAHEAYRMITQIMHLDNTFDDLDDNDRLIQRQKVLKPLVDAYFSWTKVKYEQVTKNSVIGRALYYSINQEKYLRVFLDNPRVPMDNNTAEQAIRPFTIGRKNFVIISSSNGAKASSVIYSIVETAKANNLNIYDYLELLLSEIPTHMDDKNLDFLDKLLPWSDFVQNKCSKSKLKSV